LNNPPKLIDELLSKEWLKILFDKFELNLSSSPKLEFNQGLFSHDLQSPLDIEFLTFTAKNLRVKESKYFKNFLIEFGTKEMEIFDKPSKYFTNKYHTRRSSWHYSGSRINNFKYILDDVLIGIIVTKQSDQYVGVMISSSTIEKKPKIDIDFELVLEGNFSINSIKKEFIYNDYSHCSKEELLSLEKWKNIEHSKKLQLVQLKMNRWINNLYECYVDEPTKTIRSIYLTQSQVNEIRTQTNKLKNIEMRLFGKFTMFSDYTAILKNIYKLDLIKH